MHWPLADAAHTNEAHFQVSTQGRSKHSTRPGRLGQEGSPGPGRSAGGLGRGRAKGGLRSSSPLRARSGRRVRASQAPRNAAGPQCFLSKALGRLPGNVPLKLFPINCPCPVSTDGRGVSARPWKRTLLEGSKLQAEDPRRGRCCEADASARLAEDTAAVPGARLFVKFVYEQSSNGQNFKTVPRFSFFK